MAEPTTVASAIVFSAAKGLATEIGAAIGKAIFGSDDNENRAQLNRIEANTVEIIKVSRATYRLVAKLPDVIELKIKEGTLNEVHQEFDSEIDFYTEGSQPIPRRMTQETLLKLFKMYDSVIDGEDRFDLIMKIPLYGYYLIKVSRGRLYGYVLGGAKKKVSALESLIQNRKTSILEPLLEEAQNIIDSPYVRSGELLSEEPWITWSLAKTRTKTVSHCVPTPRPLRADFGPCDYVKVKVPDTAFNNGITRSSKRLHSLRKLISEEAEIIQSAVVAKETLEKFISNIQSFGLSEESINDIEISDTTDSFQLHSLQFVEHLQPA